MSDRKPLRNVLIAIIIASVIFVLLESFGFEFQVYFLEFLIDPKHILLLILILSLSKKDQYYISTIISDIKRTQWKTSLLWLIMPLLLLSVLLFVGKIGSQIDYHNFENWPTKILQILFDYPAILFFSISTVFIDELFFRSFFYKVCREHIGIGKAIVLSSIFWSIYNLSEFIFTDPNTIENTIVYILFYFSTGILLAVLAEKHGHIFYGYIFRVGLLSFSVVLLSNAYDDQSTFFVSNSLIFSSQGIIYSFLSVFLAFFIYRDIRNNKRKMQDFEHFS
jgi:hypothetical protein